MGGVPNITGTTGTLAGAGSHAPSSGNSGAIENIWVTNLGVNASGSISTWHGLTFNASRSTSVYTDSGKVYPASVALNFIIKI